MKNLVLSALVAAVTSQAAGCIIIADDNDEPTGNRIAATWNYKIAGATQAGCPAGADGVRLMVQSLSTQAIDAVVFRCSEPILIDYFPDDNYRIWVELTLGSQPYAQSLAVESSVVAQDIDLTFDIHEDRGYFLSTWSLRGKNTNASLTCAQIANLTGIALDTTQVGSAAFTSTVMDCGPLSGFSKAIPAAQHTVSISAVDNSGRISDAVNLNNQTIQDRNRVTTLGSVVLPIIGR